jgi:hypothetical protein
MKNEHAYTQARYVTTEMLDQTNPGGVRTYIEELKTQANPGKLHLLNFLKS